MELYNYFRSSASYRVRIALALKGLPYDYKAVHLVKNEQTAESYAAVSAARLVPLLKDGEHFVHQSLAIIEYLDETHPEPPLLPATPLLRARVRAISQDIACEIHPLNNLRVLRYLVKELNVSEDDKNRWYRHWVETGLETVERQLQAAPGRFCVGDAPTMADCLLVPQIHNAHRLSCRLDHVPQVMRVFETCMAMEAFAATAPEACPDAPDAPHHDWLPATGLPPEVGGLMASRNGGVSVAPYHSMNLRPPGLRGDALDQPAAVHENQRRFAAALGGALPVYLDQVHGTRVVRVGAASLQGSPGFEQADASVTSERGVACTVLVADCLPVLLAAPGGRGVGAAHAGWRGLAGGVVEACLARLCELASCEPAEVSAWLGACIGPAQFEVGDEVREAFGPAGQQAFTALPAAGKWLADLPALARLRLAAAGVRQVSGGTWCTASDPSRFFSYRRDRITGRHAAAIWIR